MLTEILEIAKRIRCHYPKTINHEKLPPISYTNYQDISFTTNSDLLLAAGNTNLQIVDNSSNVIVEFNDSNTSGNHIVFTKRNGTFF